MTDQMIMYGGVSSPPFKAAIPEYPVREMVPFISFALH